METGKQCERGQGYSLITCYGVAPQSSEGRKRIKDFVFTFRPCFCIQRLCATERGGYALGITYNKNDVDYPAHWPSVGHGKIRQPSQWPLIHRPLMTWHYFVPRGNHARILRYLVKPSNQRSNCSLPALTKSRGNKRCAFKFSYLPNFWLENRGRDVLPFLKACLLPLNRVMV